MNGATPSVPTADAEATSKTTATGAAGVAACGRGPERAPGSGETLVKKADGLQRYGDAWWAAVGARDQRYAARGRMRSMAKAFAPGDVTATCGLILGGDVDVDADGRGVRRIGGQVVTCKAVQICPCCRVAPSMRRAVELGLAVERWHERGFCVVLLTLSFPNKAGNDPGAELDRLAAVWRGASGRKLRKWKTYYQVTHYAWATEATVSPRWWNCHRHVLLFVEMAPDDLVDRWDRFEAGLAAALRPELARTGWDERRDGRWKAEAGMDMRIVDDASIGSYLAKTSGLDVTPTRSGYGMGVGMEMTNPTAKKDGRTDGAIDPAAIPFELDRLCSARGLKKAMAEDHHVRQLARWWWTWREARRGTRLVQYSMHLRGDLFPEVDDVTDEQLVELGREGRRLDRQALAEQAGEHVDVDGGDEDLGDDEDEGEGEQCRPFSVSYPVWKAWCQHAARLGLRWGADAELCRIVERAGVWRAAWYLAETWNGPPLRLYRHRRTGRARLGDEDGQWADENGYQVVSEDQWRELADIRSVVAA